MHQQRAGFVDAPGRALLAVAEHDLATLQHVAYLKARHKRRKAGLLEGQQGAHQGLGDLQQGARGVDAGHQLLQRRSRRRQPLLFGGRRDVHADADDGVALAADGSGLDQDPGQLALLPPEVVRPLQPDGRVQAAGQADTHRQRQAGPVGRRQRQAQREGQRGARGAVPPASEPASASGLRLGHQQHRLRLAGAGPAHEFRVGGIDLRQDLDGEAGQQGRNGLPDGFGRPAHRVHSPIPLSARPWSSLEAISAGAPGAAWGRARCHGSGHCRTSRGIRPSAWACSARR